MSAIKFAEEYITQNRSKHIDIRYHYIRERTNCRDIKREYCRTNEMLVCTLTKPLDVKSFVTCRNGMKVYDLGVPENGFLTIGSKGVLQSESDNTHSECVGYPSTSTKLKYGHMIGISF